MTWTLQVFMMELRKLITYRADFWINFFGLTFFSLVLAYYLWDSIFSYTGQKSINGFSISHMIFYYLCVPLIFRVQQGQNIGFLSREIYEGHLTKYLLYPINAYRFKLATYLAHSIFYMLQLILIILVYIFLIDHEEIFQFNMLSFLAFIFVLLLGSIAYFYLFTLAELAAFWFDNIWSLGVMLRFSVSFFGGALIPLRFFPDWSRELLRFTPFPYFVDFPYQTLTGNISFNDFWVNVIITIVWLMIFKTFSQLRCCGEKVATNTQESVFETLPKTLYAFFKIQPL